MCSFMICQFKVFDFRVFLGFFDDGYDDFGGGYGMRGGGGGGMGMRSGKWQLVKKLKYNY